jgi:hypothetical protein
MRGQEDAERLAQHHAAELVRALQDADAPQPLIDQAEDVQSKI